jgi:hypothetical protein
MRQRIACKDQKQDEIENINSNQEIYCIFILSLELSKKITEKDVQKPTNSSKKKLI